MPNRIARVSICLIAVSFTNVAFAQEKKKPEKAAKVAQENPVDQGMALTEPPTGDRNYELMGEFVGQVAGQNGQQWLGMQVRPVGNENFEAVSFLGGLPGEEKHERDGTKLVGRRSGNFLVLSGGPWAVFVEPAHCTLIDSTGKNLGQLKRVNRTSPTLGALPPKDAVILFDGKHIDQFTNAQMTKDGSLMAGADMKPMFQDFDLHLEFRLPYMPQAQGQARGNSGVYLQSRYECQVLDSFAQDRFNNGCGAIYTFRAPDLNMCFPPLVWQTYDIRFTAPRWASDGTKIRNAHITSWINGVKVQDNVEVPSKTGHGQEEEPLLLPTKLQNHKDPVQFRNVWLIDRGLMTSEFPIKTPEKKETPPTPTPPVKPEAAKLTAAAEMKPTDASQTQKPDAVAAKMDQKDVAKSEPVKVEPAKPAAPKPDAPKPDAAKPAAPKPEAAKPEAPKPDAKN